MEKTIINEQRAVVLLSRITFEQEVIDELNNIMCDKMFDWFQFLKYILYHRVAALCWYNIHRLEINCSIPHYIDDMLSYIYSGNKTRNSQKIIENKKIIYNCKKHGITIIPVKGAKLLPEMYKDYGVRYSSDSDFLICEEDTERLSQAMNELGYVQGFCNRQTLKIKEASKEKKLDYKNRLNNIFPFIKYSGEKMYPTISIDFRYALGMNKQKKPINDMIEIFDENENIPDEYFILHLCSHFSEEARKSIDIFLCKDFNIIKLCDIRESIIKSLDLGECNLIEYAKKYFLQEEVYFALYYLYLVYEDSFVKEWLDQLEIDDPSLINKFGVLGHKMIDTFTKDVWQRMFSCYNLKDIKQMNNVIAHLTFDD